MREAAEKILRYAGSLSPEELAADEQRLEAIVWNLTILGEAAGHIPEHVSAAHPDVPWPRIRGARNRIVHGYDRIDFSIVWNVIRVELPSLIPQLERIERDEAEGSPDAAAL